MNLMQTFIEGLLFYHPAVWWISGVIRAERENCCDDLAVAATGDARQYAAALTALEQNRWAAHELALAATGGSLVKRIRRLLQQPERPSAAWTPIFSAGVLAVSAGIAFASWQAQPPQKAQPRGSAVLPAPPAAPVAVELPAAPVRKRRSAYCSPKRSRLRLRRIPAVRDGSYSGKQSRASDPNRIRSG